MDVEGVISRSRNFADDIDNLRSPWESITHWQVRKNFLVHNWDNFKDKDRLICLSQAWVNWRFHGNLYPEKVMETLLEMEEGLEPAEKMLRDAELQVIGICDNRPERVKVVNVHDTSKLPNFIFPMTFVKQKNSNALQKDTDNKHTDNKDMFNLNNELNEAQKRPDIDNEVTEKDHQVPAKRQKTDNVVPYLPKNLAAMSKIMNASSSGCERTTMSLSDAKCEKVFLAPAQRKFLENLVLRQRTDQLPISIINSSADFCKCSHEYVFEQKWTKNIIEFTCFLYVNGVLVGKADAGDKKLAKYAAASSALDLLRTTQSTLLISSAPGDLDSAISRSDIISRPGISRDEQKISDSNLGNQLLRKMGWKGEGGLGKTGSGISAPVTVSETFGRAGLGIDKSNVNLISFKDAHDVIRNYAASQSSDELTFSPELTKEERLKIHQLSRRYNLRSKSYNNGEVRYLVVSRKMSAAALVDELKSSGGTKGSIQLIGPGQGNSLGAPS